ncbi:sulfotransferase [Planctomycetota bacterium]
MHRMKVAIRRTIKSGISFAKSARRQKIICIGRNKTGTTSIAKALKELDFIVAEQGPAELLIHDWARRDFRRIIRFCHTAQAFQDIPFSLPYTFQALDMRFPGSKFILTVRDSPEQWYASLTRFHAKLFGSGEIPSCNDLKKAQYRYAGWMYEAFHAIYGTPDANLYDKMTLINQYNTHNQSVIEYFRQRPNDLLVLNISQQGVYQRFCEFLDKPCLHESFPWENKTAEIAVPTKW